MVENQENCPKLLEMDNQGTQVHFLHNQKTVKWAEAPPFSDVSVILVSDKNVQYKTCIKYDNMFHQMTTI